MSYIVPAVPPVPPRPSPLVRYGNFLFRARDVVFPLVLLALLVAFRPEYPFGSRIWDQRLDLIGLLIAATGQALRCAVVGYAYIIRGGKNRQVYAEGLVTEGFFHHARNPLYVGNILILAGLFLIWNSRWMYAIGIPFFLLGYVAIVAAEENFLRGKFGAAYDRYAAEVNRWIPDLRGLGASLAGMTFNWRRVILKEYGSAAYWVAGAIVLMALDGRWAERGSSNAGGLWWLLVPVVVAWGAARWAKKSKRLRETPA